MMGIKIIRDSDSRRSVFLWGILLFFLTLAATAQDELNSEPQKLPGEAPSIRFEHLGMQDGLQQGSVNDIIQDREGFLWIATQAGLHRYDGYEFKVYSNIPFDTTSLPSEILYNLEESPDGDIWLTTEGAGLHRMERDNETFSNYLHDPEDSTSLSSNYPFDVKESDNGDLWVSTLDAGLNQMQAGKDGQFRRYRHDPDDPGTLTSDDLFWIEKGPEGMIWAGSTNGINRVDPETGQVERFLYDPERIENYAGDGNVFHHYFPPGEPGIVWLATAKGLVRLDTETGEHERFLIEEGEDPLNRLNLIHKVIPDPSEPGVLWVAGPGTGVARFDKSTREFTSYRHDPRDPNSLAEDETWTLFADRTGNMWTGHYGKGLSIFNPGAVNFSHLRHDSEDPQSLAPGAVWAIYEDQKKDLWIGTYLSSVGGYLTHFNTRTGEITRHQHDPNDSLTLPSGNNHAFAEDESGQFWVGSTHGLSRLDRETGVVTRFAHQPPEENRTRNTITALLPVEDKGSQLWVGSVAGLDRFDTQTGNYTSVGFNEGKPIVLSLMKAKNNILWVGTNQGIFRIDDSGVASLASAYDPQDTTTISNNMVNSILEREREPGILWLATKSGLNRYDTQTGVSKHYTQKDGLANNTIYGILEDSNGSLWMSTNGGISNFDPQDGTFRNYGLDDGLMALEYDQFAFAKGADGMMYFGSLEGVTGFMPEKLTTNKIPPQVALSGFKLFNKEVTPGPESVLTKPLSETEEISLDYSQNEITFDFVALHYGNPAKNSYAYMLEGFDEEWVEAGQRRSATYTNLSPGSYTFKVKAANADGIWSEEEASVQLTVLPPWYQTWWAYLLFAVLLGVLIFGIDRYQRQRLQKKEQERTALREAELRAEAENRRRADTEQLSNIGQAITSSLSITRIIETVYEHVNELMDAAIFGVGIYNKDKNRLDFPATKENGVMLPPYAHRLTEENRLAVWCYNNSKEIIIGDAEKETGNYVNKFLPPIEGNYSKSVIYLPLVQQGRTIGVITTQSFETHAYTPYHVHLLRNLATYAAIALDNASAYRQLDSTLKDLKVMQEQLVQQEKLASLGQLTAGIAHEIKNPLNFVNNFSELSVELIGEAREELAMINKENSSEKGRFLTTSELLDDIESNLKKIHKHGTRADGIVRSMLQHSRGGSGRMEPTDLNELIREYVNLTFHGMRAGKKPINVELDLQLDEQVQKIPLIEEDFSRVIINLCNNAFEAMREKSLLPSINGNYLPKLSVRSIWKKSKVTIEFADNGPGIPEEIKTKILQPFFTTKKGTDGTGLGLSITNDIIKSHGGTLSIKSSGDTGTCFIVDIPVLVHKEVKRM